MYLPGQRSGTLDLDSAESGPFPREQAQLPQPYTPVGRGWQRVPVYDATPGAADAPAEAPPEPEAIPLAARYTVNDNDVFVYASCDIRDSPKYRRERLLEATAAAAALQPPAAPEEEPASRSASSSSSGAPTSFAAPGLAQNPAPSPTTAPQASSTLHADASGGSPEERRAAGRAGAAVWTQLLQTPSEPRDVQRPGDGRAGNAAQGPAGIWADMLARESDSAAAPRSPAADHGGPDKEAARGVAAVAAGVAGAAVTAAAAVRVAAAAAEEGIFDDTPMAAGSSRADVPAAAADVAVVDGGATPTSSGEAPAARGQAEMADPREYTLAAGGQGGLGPAAAGAGGEAGAGPAFDLDDHFELPGVDQASMSLAGKDRSIDSEGAPGQEGEGRRGEGRRPPAAAGLPPVAMYAGIGPAGTALFFDPRSGAAAGGAGREDEDPAPVAPPAEGDTAPGYFTDMEPRTAMDPSALVGGGAERAADRRWAASDGVAGWQEPGLGPQAVMPAVPLGVAQAPGGEGGGFPWGPPAAAEEAAIVLATPTMEAPEVVQGCVPRRRMQGNACLPPLRHPSRARDL